jgi:IS5 family transposase
MSTPKDERQKDLFRPALDSIIDMHHPLVLLAQRIDWAFLERRLGSVYRPGPGQPPLPVRLMAGLMILKHMESLSDEVLCARFLDSPYVQFFCGEVSFRHDLPFDSSSCQRLGEEHLTALLQESLSVAHRSGALTTRDLERVAVDTTVQPKAVAYPTDARLMHRALIKLVDLARKCGVRLRQSYRRVAKHALIQIGRYQHAHQFKRANRELRFLRARLWRVIRDVRRKINGNAALEERFGPLLALAARVRSQTQRQRGPKVYALRAGGGVHRQGQGPHAVRVRLQGEYRHSGDEAQRRSVRAACPGLARQSV